MTAQPETRTVRLSRAARFYPSGYFDALIDVRMPAVVEGGRVLSGFLVAAEEIDAEIVLTFEELAPEE